MVESNLVSGFQMCAAASRIAVADRTILNQRLFCIRISHEFPRLLPDLGELMVGCLWPETLPGIGFRESWNVWQNSRFNASQIR